jgi:hypothetical protein
VRVERLKKVRVDRRRRGGVVVLVAREMSEWRVLAGVERDRARLAYPCGGMAGCPPEAIMSPNAGYVPTASVPAQEARRDGVS